MSKVTHTREHILLVAGQVILTQGVSALTLETVAQAAGVSKGGLLYYFPNKVALLQGMIDSYLESFNNQVEELSQTLDGNGRWVKAFVIISFDDSLEPLIVATAIVTLVNTPDLLRQIQQQSLQWRQRALSEGIDPLALSLIFAATDGTWYAKGFGIAILNTDERSALRNYLLNLIEEEMRL